MEKRNYRLKKRAESQEVTRARIVDALMHLHEEVGPKNTTISAIAERAGVQRLTVYRHFPNEEDLFHACTSHWIELNPPPDPQRWAGIEDPYERCASALADVYAYYAATRRMWIVSFRDEGEVPALRAPMDAFRAYLAGVADDLLGAFDPPQRRRGALAATLSHALRFSTWSSLHEEDLDGHDAVNLVIAWIRGLEAND